MHPRFHKLLLLGLNMIPNAALASVAPADTSSETLLILVLGILILISGAMHLIPRLKPRNNITVKLKKYLGAIERMSHKLQPLLLQTSPEEKTEETIHWLLKETARTIDSAQVSLWRFNDENSSLTQCYCFESQHDTPAPSLHMTSELYPTLFTALQREKALSITDIKNDLRSIELHKIYTKNDAPLSVLMVHINFGQNTHGILQIHTRRQHRHWDDSDRQFANAVADLFSLYLSTTELQKAQESLTDNETKLRDLVDASSDWYWETDRNHCFSYFSDQFTQLTGIDETQLIGKTRLDLKPHASQSAKWKQHLEDLDNHRPFRNFQYTTRIGDREISVTSNGKPFFDKNGEFAGYRGTGSDHTESTVFKARFEEGLNALPNGFLMWDSQDRLIMWNNTIFDMFPALTPYANKKPTFLKLMQICHREKIIKYPRPFTKTYAKVIVHAHQNCGINEVELTNGRHLLVHEHKTSEGGIVGIYTDITALKEREKEILEGKKISETLSSCSNILFHARNESFILSEICRIITDTFPFDTAWISLFNTTGQLPEFLKVNMLRGRQLPQTSYRPSSTLKQAFIKQEYMILNENLLLQAYPDFKAFFQDTGARTAGIFPIWIDTKLTGFLTVVSSNPGTFHNRYINLMSELANDVGYGLTSLRSEHSRLIAEEALRESEGRYRSLVDMSPDAILVLDEQHKIVFSNPEGHVLFATTNRAEIYHKSFYDFLVKEQDLFANAPRITDDDPTQFIGSVTLRRMDERLFEADITARPVSYSGLTTRLLIIRDVTERNRVNEHLAQTSKLATLGEMAAGITHELSQPLNIMRFAAEGSLLKMQRGTLEKDESQKKFDLISMQCGRMADIIDHMRIFSRKDTGDLELFDPTLVVRQSVDLIESQFLAEGIHLDVRYPAHYAMLNGRPIQLEQVILNLVNNARDAINQRHQTTNWEEDENKQIILQITYDQADHKINIAITDNGGGIPEDALAKLFDPFFTTKEVGKGTGLGLSVSYGIIAAMGGAIRARNIHKGARFDITLPCATEEEEKFSPKRLAEKMVNKNTPLPIIELTEDEDDDLDMNADGAKVLVVDDEIYAAEAMMEYLFDQGYQVNIAGDGEEALELYDMEAVDVVVTDMRMPRMDGYVLIQNLKKRCPSLPVIVVTGHTGMDDADQHDLNTLAFKILKKPVSLSYLSESIEEALQSVHEKTFSTIED
ncbi:response regulator [Terasakiella sp.]|uniref:response regulator n=1 Tax=Terasakiella sp. TaxID=2034861 RepID=UPI003AA942DD